jgi:hypothetical protein
LDKEFEDIKEVCKAESVDLAGKKRTELAKASQKADPGYRDGHIIIDNESKSNYVSIQLRVARRMRNTTNEPESTHGHLNADKSGLNSSWTSLLIIINLMFFSKRVLFTRTSVITSVERFGPQGNRAVPFQEPKLRKKH